MRLHGRIKKGDRMPTALSLITDALIEIGAHDLGQSVPAEDAAMCLRRLNQMMGRWSQQSLLMPTLTQFDVPTTGAASYTIGPTGDVVAARPLKIDRATATLGGVESPVDVLTRAQWDAIAVKAVDGPPSAVWYEATTPDGRIHVYPRASGYTLHLDGQALLASFPQLTTDMTLPEGYEAAVVLSLACDLSGPYNKPISPDLRGKTAGAVKAIKRTNTEPLILESQRGLGTFQIERGY